MRTSIKILTVALALVFISLLIYDSRLKAKYLKGDFRNPYGDFVPANYSNFNAIDLQSGTAVNLIVTKGPYKVLVDPVAGDFVKISRQGSTLTIYAVFKDHYRSIASDYTVFISCPDLKAFTSDARYEVNDAKVTDSLPNIFEKKSTLISGFNTASLAITESNGSNIKLENNRIGSLRAVVGAGYNAGAIITIGHGNTFNTADLNILNKGILNIESPAGNDITYHLADSAKLSVNGAISKQLFKTIQP